MFTFLTIIYQKFTFPLSILHKLRLLYTFYYRNFVFVYQNGIHMKVYGLCIKLSTFLPLYSSSEYKSQLLRKINYLCIGIIIP